MTTNSLEPSIHLRFESETRYCVLRLEPDLFCDWALLKVWGGKTNRLGQQRLEHFGSSRQGFTRMEEARKRRLKRQYELR